MKVSNGWPLVELIAQHIRSLRQHKPLTRITVITPSLFSAFYLRRAVTSVLCDSDDKGLFNVEFMRIEEVTDQLFDATSRRPSKPPMSRLVASELIRNAMNQLDEPGPLSVHSENASTLNAIQRTLQDLELLDGAAETALLKLVQRGQGDIYRQLLEIHRQYKQAASAYLTRENKASIAAATALNNSDALESTLGSDLLLIQVPTAPNAHSGLRDALESLDCTATFHLVTEDMGEAVAGDETKDTRFYSTMSAADEPRALIRNIMDDARAGVRFGEMAVFYPSKDYASRIQDALNAARIPNCGPSPMSLAETPVGKFISHFLALIDSDMRSDLFASWTSSAPVINPKTGDRVPTEPWAVAARFAKIYRFDEGSGWRQSLERYAKRMQSRGFYAQMMSDEDHDLDPDSLLDAASHAEQLGIFLHDLIQRTDVDDVKSWSGWVKWLNYIIDYYLYRYREPDELEISGMQRIRVGLEQVAELDAVTLGAVPFTRFASAVHGILRATVGGSSGWGSAVLVAPLEAGVGSAFKQVHILGMTERVMPSPTRLDPLLSDDHKQLLDSEGTRLATRSDLVEYDRRVFDLALSSVPSRRLYWNRALLGETNESYPSPWFVDEVQRTYGETGIAVKDLMDPLSKYVEATTALSDLGTSDFVPASEYEFLNRDVAIRSQHHAGRQALLTEPENAALAAGRVAVDSRYSYDFGPHDGNVSQHINKHLTLIKASANSLQSYAECPYRYFLATQLDVNEKVEPEDSLSFSNLDKGLLVHSILEHFFKEVGADDSDYGVERLREISHKEFDRFQREQYTGYAAIFDLEKSQLLDQLEEWLQSGMHILDGYDGEFKTEHAFGYVDEEQVDVRLSDGFTFRMRGKIDIIAVAEARDRALLMDFKTGASRGYTKIDEDPTDAGTKLQLPVYAKVASSILGRDVEIRTAYWFVFEQENSRLQPGTPATAESMNERFGQVLEVIGNGIRKGIFPARPGKRSSYGGRRSWDNCRYCAYNEVCTSDRLNSWERKKLAPELHQYLALSERVEVQIDDDGSD